jgi:antitoxin HicB
MRSGGITMHFKIPLVFEPQPEGGFTATVLLLPELITDGENVEDALENVRDAWAAVLEADREMGRPLPTDIVISDKAPVRLETIVAIS